MKTSRFTSILILFAIFSCHRNHSVTTVKVHVKTGEGEDITGASVMVDQELVGETNAFGTLTYSFDPEQGSVHRIDIVKASDTYYFAPHFETLKIPKVGKSDWPVQATMYMVPKPRPTKTNLSEEIALKSPVSAADATDAKVAKPIVKDIGILSGYPFLDEDFSARATLDFSSDMALAGGLRDNTENAPLFTVHTYTGRDPLANVEVYSCRPGVVPELLCKSNDRGRCVVRAAASSLASTWSLIVKHSTTKTQIVKGPFDRNTNVRLTMVPGRSEDYLFLFDDIGPRKPAQDISVATSGGESAVLISSPCGVASVPSPKAASEVRHLRASHASIQGGFQEVAPAVAGAFFQEILLKPSKSRQPSLVVEPLLPGANLTQEDLKRWFDATQLRRVNQDVVRGVKARGIDSISLEEFQDLNRNPKRSMAVVERVVTPWNLDSTALSVATHRLRSVLVRTSEGLALSVQIFDASAKMVLGERKMVSTPNDISMVATASIANFVTSMSSGIQFQISGVAVPAGKWLSLSGDSSEPIAIDATNMTTLKGRSGFLDTDIQLASEAAFTVVYEPIVGVDDVVAKLYDEAEHLDAGHLLQLLADVKKDHPQIQKISFIAAFLESLNPDGPFDHLKAKAESVLENESLVQLLNRSIARSLIADRSIDTKDEKIKNALIAIRDLDDVLRRTTDRPSGQGTEIRKTALYFRGQSKSIVGDLKNDPMVSMDAEADIREFMKESEVKDKDKKPASPREERLRVAAAKALKSFDVH